MFAPLKKLVKSGVFSGSKIKYFVVLSVSSFQKFLEEMRNYIHGELSEWSKVQHSKSGSRASVSWVRIPPCPPKSLHVLSVKAFLYFAKEVISNRVS